MKKHSKQILFVLALGLLLYPLFSDLFKIGNIEKLNGVYHKTEKPEFVLSDFLGHSYQDSITAFVKGDLHIRPTLVRTHNQINYSLFDTVYSAQVYHWNKQFFRFYMWNYTDEMEYDGLEQHQERIRKLTDVKDSLQVYGVDLAVMISPSKAHFYEDKMKAGFLKKPRWSNYADLDSLLSTSELMYIDVNDWFVKARDTFSRVPFGSGGIHWNMWSAALVMDSLNKRIKQNGIIKNFVAPRWKISENYELWSPDMDLANLANLLVTPKDTSLRMVYMQGDGPKNNLKTIVNSDSYFDVISWTGMSKYYFGEETEYWYYNATHILNSGENIKHVTPTKQKLIEQNLVIIMYSIPNLPRFSNGMIEEMYTAFHPEEKN